MKCQEFLTESYEEVKSKLAKVKEIASKATKKSDKDKALEMH